MKPSMPRLLAFLALALIATPVAALADQSSQPSSPAAGRITAGSAHSCAIVAGAVRCWGFGGDGRLGNGATQTIGDDETPASQPPVDVGAGRSAAAVSASDGHTCALLDDAMLRCWGFGGNGRLGYANTNSIGDDETPAAAGPVDLGDGRTARAVSAGASHTCAVLDDATVRCWGYAAQRPQRTGPRITALRTYYPDVRGSQPPSGRAAPTVCQDGWTSCLAG